MTAARRWLGIDLGATKLLGAVWGGGDEPLAVESDATLRAEGSERVLARVVALARRLERAAGPFAGAGIGFAGLVDAGRGVVDSSIMLPGFEDVPLATTLQETLSVPFVADNDATAAGFGEFVALGRPRGLDLVLLTLGTGIGGAIVLDGRLHRGASSTSGELGNTTIDWRGRACPSGNRGSLNSLASGGAIALRAEEAAAADPGGALARLPRPLTAKSVAALARDGERAATEILAEAGAALGAGLANFLNIFNPHRIALMGGLTAIPAYVDAARAEARARAFPRNFRRAAIALATRGELTGSFGAACLAQEALP